MIPPVACLIVCSLFNLGFPSPLSLTLRALPFSLFHSSVHYFVLVQVDALLARVNIVPCSSIVGWHSRLNKIPHALALEPRVSRPWPIQDKKQDKQRQARNLLHNFAQPIRCRKPSNLAVVKACRLTDCVLPLDTGKRPDRIPTTVEGSCLGLDATDDVFKRQSASPPEAPERIQS